MDYFVNECESTLPADVFDHSRNTGLPAAISPVTNRAAVRWTFSDVAMSPFLCGFQIAMQYSSCS